MYTKLQDCHEKSAQCSSDLELCQLEKTAAEDHQKEGNAFTEDMIQVIYCCLLLIIIDFLFVFCVFYHLAETFSLGPSKV